MAGYDSIRDALDAEARRIEQTNATSFDPVVPISMWHRIRSAYDNEVVALRARLAEVERERESSYGACDSLRSMLRGVELERDAIMRHEGMAVAKYANACAERDDARRVAKSLALYREHKLRGTLSKWDADQRTAIAYEVEP